VFYVRISLDSLLQEVQATGVVQTVHTFSELIFINKKRDSCEDSQPSLEETYSESIKTAEQRTII